MLQVVDISKEYRTGSLVQRALNHVSLNLRDNEFVAILGPSGSGKTTLLNIIGGLDRYDSGDLVINDISTKKYKDRDWDSYRNHTIGFVFQSYNLIPHQSILANVELALTISGVSGTDRRERAKEALEKVGLAEHIHKKPNQLSGGQMQRVAIARALVNNPDILLADEPTGALDSETSIQVMDLLKEVAEDRLVVMVTHNPELAEAYATRIVRLKDGAITDDSDPFVPETNLNAVHRNLGRAKMSFLTALALSFNNLRTKFTRTMLIAFAGSIGIIGIALIMALSNGVNLYIKNVEEETLKEYPLSITGYSFDLGSLMESRGSDDEEEESTERAEVREMQTVTTLFTTLTTNDLTSLKKFLDSDRSHVKDYSNAIEYSYSISPIIYIRGENGYRQVNPDTLMSAMGYSSSMSSLASMFGSMGNTDVFHAMPETEELYINQYDVKAGRWPEDYNECVLVLSSYGSVSDVALYDLNKKDPSELERMIADFLSGKGVEITESSGRYTYEEFLGISFKLINASDCFSYDSEYRVWTDKREDRNFMNSVIENSEDLKIVGVVQPKEDASVAMLNYGINYPAGLTYHCIEKARDSEIVRNQMRDPDTDVITGKAFGDTERTNLDMMSLFSIDEDALREAFNFDFDSMDIDYSGAMSGLDFSDLMPAEDFSISIPQMDMTSLLGDVNVNISEESMRNLFSELMSAYSEYSESDPATSWSKLPEALSDYLASEEAQSAMAETVSSISEKMAASAITTEELRSITDYILTAFAAYLAANDVENVEDIPDYIEAFLDSEEAQEVYRKAAESLIAKVAEASASSEDLSALGETLTAGYEAYAAENGLPQLSAMEDSFAGFLKTDTAGLIIRAAAQQAVDTSVLEARLSEILGSFAGQMTAEITAMMTGMITGLSEKLAEEIPLMMSEMMAQMGDAFSFDANAFAGAISMNLSDEELKELMTSLMSSEATNYSGNLQKFGYVSVDEPSTINIYPIDFECKAEIKAILDGYNRSMEEAGEEEKTITYTDLVGTLMSQVTEIINAISYVLIAFVAISLVVSSIMIGVITYISVLERRKEIGILRAIGASKHNISEVFNAETIIIGVLAGLIGVVITELILIPANIILQKVTGQDIHAVLPFVSAALLVALSTVLTMIGGLIPAKKASRQDPVTALRTD
ncbi:MAG: ABC transporter ATP-binding protein/permease [Lachnospiraceae bacterium]|nr:ABC transporter ATP-binding protein/permease [Lachnospiraceae bacterium]